MPYKYKGLIFSRRYKAKKNGEMKEYHYKVPYSTLPIYREAFDVFESINPTD